MSLKKSLLALCVSGLIPTYLVGQNPPPAPPPTPPTGQSPVVITPTQPTAAQAAAAALGKQPTNAQISDAIKQSGLSEQQLKERLKGAGYDPQLADPFFAKGSRPEQPAAASGDQPAQSTPSGAFAKALSELGILSLDAASAKTPEEVAERAPEADVANLARGGSRSGGVFGKDVFARSSTQFDPVISGPVDPAYRIGVGDQVQLIVTGQVELAYALDVRRDGSVVIPQVGQIDIAGLSMEGARALLKTRMARSYSGLTSGEASLDLTISRIRSNSVFVIGEVEHPGAYQVNALSTVFHALTRAGGPTVRGSFRSVEVRRGGRTIRTIDLYDYLLRGDGSNDIRTEQGDFIFVPLNTRAVAITGAVRRPGVFELKQNESFADLLGFAGGLLSTASLDRVQIDRIVPPERRQPGFERVKIDIPLHGHADSLQTIALHDSDIITVFSIGDLRRNVVTVGGAVFQPGQYEYTAGMTLDTLLRRAQGPLPTALTDRIKIRRAMPASGQDENLSLDLANPAFKNFPIVEFDQVLVLDGRAAFPQGSISISGAVQRPFEAQFAEHTSLQDIVDLADGFREDAASISVSRHRVGADYSDTTSVVLNFTIGADRRLTGENASFMLARDDRVIVRSSPGFRPQQFVTVEGLFAHPGTYAIAENQDRLQDLVSRAGGTLPGAYGLSFKLSRAGRAVAVDYGRAMLGDRVNNVLLRSGDALSIEANPRTVLVNGAVTRPALIVYRPGLSALDYVELAGGPSDRANRKGTIVEYPSGYSKRVRSFLGVVYSEPDIVSGATITVPEKPENKTSSDAVWARVFTGASALATLILAAVAMRRL